MQLARQALKARDGKTSWLEDWFDVEWVGPEPIAELQFAKVFGRRWRFDRAWPDHQIALELDGWGHQKSNRYLADIDKGNAAALLGWRVFHITDRMIKAHDGEEAHQILDVIGALLEEKHEIQRRDLAGVEGFEADISHDQAGRPNATRFLDGGTQ